MEPEPPRVRKLDDYGVRLRLGRDAGSDAYIALSFRALGVSMSIFAGLWGVVMLLKSLQLLVGVDQNGWLFSTSWWVAVSLTAVFALVGVLGFRLFHVWERRALGDQHGEIRLKPRPDPN